MTTHVFPSFTYYDDGEKKSAAPEGGLTKRELFMLVVMLGIVSNPDSVGSPDEFSKEALTQANSMIAVLEGKHE